jgi:GDP/UDP-N,N'-diacetylbacillosamine 2-epimerase (hydrolysing)
MMKIAVITGTRAEYGLLRPLIKKINEHPIFELQLYVTAMHLSPEFGLTINEIKSDGFAITKKIETLMSSDTGVGVVKSMGLTLISFSEAFNELKPDLVIVLGDRTEIFSAATAAHVLGIPIAHIHGGEVTEGAYDEAIRHSITKMSYWHFTATEEYRKRVIQLGESPKRVFNVGAIGLDSIKDLKLLSKEEFEKSINFKLAKNSFLVTFHPVTLEDYTFQKQFQALLEALSQFEETTIIFTKPNSDKGGRELIKMIDDYVSKSSNSIAFNSLGQLRYLSALQYVTMVIGNSSSGIIETPSFKIPTVNIGDRQKGRVRAKNILDCNANKNDIIKTIQIGLSSKFKNQINKTINPYGDGTGSKKIINILNQTNRINLKKEFYNVIFEYKNE